MESDLRPPDLTIRLWEITEPEKQGWVFEIPELLVIGGGCRTLRAALLHSLEAMAYAKAELPITD